MRENKGERETDRDRVRNMISAQKEREREGGGDRERERVLTECRPGSLKLLHSIIKTWHFFIHRTFIHLLKYVTKQIGR